MFVFLFKQKTAYEMRISDWSSDVCSSDLTKRQPIGGGSVTTLRSGHRLEAPEMPTGKVAVQAPPELQPHEGAGNAMMMAIPMLGSVGSILVVASMSGSRSEERRVGKECVSTFRSRWSPYN